MLDLREEFVENLRVVEKKATTKTVRSGKGEALVQGSESCETKEFWST